MKYPRYPAYKDSGVEWIGEIPEHWHTVKLKNVISCKITDGPHVTPDFVDEGYPFLSIDAIQDGELKFDHCRYISINEHIEFTKKAKPIYDDILIGKAASVGKIARVKVDFEFSIWSPLALIKLKKEQFDPTLVEYSLKSYPVQFQIKNLSTYNTQSNISMDVLPNLSFSVPPQIEEQKVISVILKNILRRIDLLISKQFRLIEMLKEKRQAIITKAVTKGLDPNVQMKDSGVEWIGEIPEHWKIKPLYSLMRENKTKNTEDENLEVLSLSYGNIIIRNVGNNFGLLPESFATYQVVDKENIILRLTDLQNDKKSLRVGLVKQKGIITSAYVCLQMSAVLIPEFAYFMLHSYDISKVFYGFGGGVRQTMTFKDLKHLPLLYPEIDEQIQIIKHIKTEIDKLDILILKQEEFIELLREYRTSLISHAVTGKIDIRGFATDSNSA